MLKFVNKHGNKVMEMKDNGEVTVLDKELKESFEKEINLREIKGEKKDDK